MPSSPLTILIPTYNPGDQLGGLLKCIALASANLAFPIQIELSDDRSPHPPTNFSEFSAEGNRLSVRLHSNESNLGEAGNVNHAMQRLASNGCEWLMLMHQDDFVNCEWLRRCRNYIDNWVTGMPEMLFAENVGIYSLDALPKDISNFSNTLDEAAHVDIPPLQEGLDYISDHWAWIPSGTLFRTKTFLDMGGFFQRLKYAGDNDFFVRWVLCGHSARQVRQKAIYKLIHDASSTSRCVTNGWDNDAWCYLLLRYAKHKTPTRNIQDHIAWLYRNARLSLSALRRPNPRMLFSRLNGLTIGIRSLLASRMPSMEALLPGEIRRLLQEAPPIKKANCTGN